MQITSNSSQAVMLQGAELVNPLSGFSDSVSFSFRQSLGSKLSEKAQEKTDGIKDPTKSARAKDGLRSTKATKKEEHAENVDYTLLAASALRSAVRNIEGAVQENPDPQVWAMIEALMEADTQEASRFEQTIGVNRFAEEAILVSDGEKGGNEPMFSEMPGELDRIQGLNALKTQGNPNDSLNLEKENMISLQEKSGEHVQDAMVSVTSTGNEGKPVTELTKGKSGMEHSVLELTEEGAVEESGRVSISSKEENEDDRHSDANERMFSTIGRIRRFEHENPRVKETVEIIDLKDDGLRLHIIEQIEDFTRQHDIMAYKQGIELTLNPAGLGKIGIIAKQLSTGVAISIACENGRTYKLLSDSSERLGNIMEKRLGEPTVVHIGEKNTDYLHQNRQRDDSREGYRQERREESKNETDSFVARLKLGLS